MVIGDRSLALPKGALFERGLDVYLGAQRTARPTASPYRLTGP